MATAQTRLDMLPPLRDRPGGVVVIFDGNCRFCQAQMRLLARLDLRRRLAFISLHDDEVVRRWPDLSHQQLLQQMYVIDRQGHRHPGAAAFRYLTRILPPLWPLAPLMHIPFSLPLWQVLYRIVAKHRYRFGRTAGCDNGDSCSLHFH